MNTIAHAINSNVDIVFFFYGMAFVVMGVAILTHPKKDSAFGLAEVLWLVGWFGITHGANEFLDMWRIIKKAHSHTLDLTQWLCLTVSYLFLLQAGKAFLGASRPGSFLGQRRKPPLFPGILRSAAVVLIVALSSLSSDFLMTANVLTRWFLGLPAGLLTGLALLTYYRDEAKVFKPLGVRTYFLASGGAFIVYSLLAGLVVPPAGFFPADRLNTETFRAAVGLPAQLFRAACALMIGWGILGIVKIYEWETKELRQTMASAIVHDLRNPMSTILLSLSMLADEPMDQEAGRSLLTRVMRNCRRLIGVADLLLDVDRLEAGALKPVRERVEAARLFDECTLDIDVARSMNVQVHMGDLAALPALHVDKGLMQRVFCNLVQNAIKFTPAKGGITIECSYDELETVFLVQVRDTGVGIPKEEIGNLFRKYYRAKGTTRQGTGLGLYFCRLVVEAHGGAIGVKSAPGIGTTVSVTIPESAP